MAKKDYYVILGVPRSESQVGIHEAYRKLAKKYHPDLGGPETAETFREIAHAHEILSDPEQRRTYDQTLRREEESLRSERFGPVTRPQRYRPEPLVPRPASVFSDFQGARPVAEALFDRRLRNFTGIAMPAGPPIDRLDFDFVLTPREAAHGVSAPIGLPVYQSCSLCDGSGRDWLFLCVACGGQGLVEQEVAVPVHIPPMVRERSVIEVPIELPGPRDYLLRLHIRISR